MKRYILMFVMAFCALTFAIEAADKGAAITFEQTKHDFGTIHADKGLVKAVYRFTNTGTEPLVIVSVTNGGCGCTTPSYPKAPIAPGKSGEISITFNPQGRRGEFNREVKVKTNASKKRVALKFSGVIIP
ncbi:MAG: DUF1573 domain-containing protein [Bacteroides sp.]|nr:DUF1573 domain-containing protein [Bacteroides sp.]MCM1413635.1 DUF1573 domain-containing protein [Bacteroides sp.]MCM1471148.1 DUF1573 domain-containing protein [Bacteroides sp.]